MLVLVQHPLLKKMFPVICYTSDDIHSKSILYASGDRHGRLSVQFVVAYASVSYFDTIG